MSATDAPSAAAKSYLDLHGIEVVKATAEEVVLRMPVDARHHQPMGIVHGGVYCGLVETACSIGASVAAQPYGKMAVGLDNQTSFLHAVRGGVLTTTARPVVGGRRTALWEADIVDEGGRLVSRGQLRLLPIDAGSPIAGEAAAIRSRQDRSD